MTALRNPSTDFLGTKGTAGDEPPDLNLTLL
jgi:hypothetical protein